MTDLLNRLSFAQLSQLCLTSCVHDIGRNSERRPFAEMAIATLLREIQRSNAECRKWLESKEQQKIRGYHIKHMGVTHFTTSTPLSIGTFDDLDKEVQEIITNADKKDLRNCTFSPIKYLPVVPTDYQVVSKNQEHQEDHPILAATLSCSQSVTPLNQSYDDLDMEVQKILEIKEKNQDHARFSVAQFQPIQSAVASQRSTSCLYLSPGPTLTPVSKSFDLKQLSISPPGNDTLDLWNAPSLTPPPLFNFSMEDYWKEIIQLYLFEDFKITSPDILFDVKMFMAMILTGSTHTDMNEEEIVNYDANRDMEDMNDSIIWKEIMKIDLFGEHQQVKNEYIGREMVPTKGTQLKVYWNEEDQRYSDGLDSDKEITRDGTEEDKFETLLRDFYGTELSHNQEIYQEDFWKELIQLYLFEDFAIPSPHILFDVKMFMAMILTGSTHTDMNKEEIINYDANRDMEDMNDSIIWKEIMKIDLFGEHQVRNEYIGRELVPTNETQPKVFQNEKDQRYSEDKDNYDYSSDWHHKTNHEELEKNERDLNDSAIWEEIHKIDLFKRHRKPADQNSQEFLQSNETHQKVYWYENDQSDNADDTNDSIIWEEIMKIDLFGDPKTCEKIDKNMSLKIYESLTGYFCQIDGSNNVQNRTNEEESDRDESVIWKEIMKIDLFGKHQELIDNKMTSAAPT